MQSKNQSKSKGAPPPFPQISETQMEQYFCGYHYLNCMLSLIKRKEELLRLVQSYEMTEN